MGTLLNVLKHVMAKRDHRAGALKLAAPVAVILTCLLCALWQPEGVDAIVAERSTSSKWIDSDSVKEKLAQIQTDTMDEVEHPTEPRLSIRAAENELDEDTRILKKAVGASSTHKKSTNIDNPFTTMASTSKRLSVDSAESKLRREQVQYARLKHKFRKAVKVRMAAKKRQAKARRAKQKHKKAMKKKKAAAAIKRLQKKKNKKKKKKDKLKKRIIKKERG